MTPDEADRVRERSRAQKEHARTEALVEARAARDLAGMLRERGVPAFDELAERIDVHARIILALLSEVRRLDP